MSPHGVLRNATALRARLVRAGLPSTGTSVQRRRKDDQRGREVTLGLGRLRIRYQGRDNSDDGVLSRRHETTERPEEILEFVK